MTTVILLLLVIVVVVLVVVVLRMRRDSSRDTGSQRPTPSDPLTSHEGVTDVRTVRAGDMVDYQGVLYFVRGSLRLEEGGSRWAEHFLDDSQGRRCWISVEEDPDLEVVMWQPTDTVTEPAGNQMELDGHSYQLQERGTASYTSEGTTTLAETGSVEYRDYRSQRGDLLSFERFGDGEWEAATGAEVIQSGLRVYPAGSSRS